MTRIVVPLDGSELAERALPLAVSLARLSGSSIRLVDATFAAMTVDAGSAALAVQEASEEYLESKRDALVSETGLQVDARAALSIPVELILEHAQPPDASAIVMTTHGRTGLPRALMGSVAERVVREAAVPVFLVPSRAGATAGRQAIRSVLVPLDGSGLAYSVFAAVTDLAKKAGAGVTLLRVFGDFDEFERAPDEPLLRAVEAQADRLEAHAHDYFRPIKAHLRSRGLMVTAEWQVGDPAKEILATAERLHPSLIALATHGRSGLDRLRDGSVAEAVLRHATVPVMTFGPHALRRLIVAVEAESAERRAAAVL